MIQLSLFKDLITRLIAINIPYMIVGGVACVIYGKPRTTHDIDLVTEIKSTDIQKLIATFPLDLFYISLDSSSRAI